jgi:replicative DNA helicase
MAAAGLHPFTGVRIRPVKAHILDLENPHRIMRKNLRRLQLLADSDGSAGATGRVFVDRRPDGLDLSKPGDLGWLLRRLQHTDPDILVIGPLYKLTASDPSEERPARLLAEALDMIRTRVGCALLIEHHAGHGNGHTVRPVRPTGSSVWLRWPEFGMGLRLAAGDDSARLRRLDVVPWRGGRDDREWPRRLIAGPRWPFQVEDTYYEGVA